MSKDISIIIGGDIVPTKSNIHFFEQGRLEEIIDKKLLSLLESADIRVFNLETPITDIITPIEKEGPCFSTSEKSIRGIKQLNPTILTLANNHILDQGVSGLLSTMDILANNKIAYTGVGENSIEANRAICFEYAGVKIGVYGCVEHEYSQATKTKMGANAFDPFDTIDAIKQSKNDCDLLLVLYHGGKEYYRYPSPELQKRIRKIVEAGADVVICQHSHCVGTIEKYKDAFILYGQGNFILDQYIKAYEEYFQTGLLVKVIVTKGKVDYELIPIKKEGKGVRLANEQEYGEIICELNQRSCEMEKPNFIEENFARYVKNIGYRYIYRMSRFGYIISSIDNRFFHGKLLSKDLKKFLGKHERLAIQNCLQCEVHNEVLRVYLNNRD